MVDEQSSAFEILPIPRKDVPRLVVSRYRIYKDAKEFTIVDGATALEALNASGLKDAFKIQRDFGHDANLVHSNAWNESAPAPATAEPAVAPEPVAAVAPAETAAA